MRKVDALQGKRQQVVFFLTALVIVVADQLSKTWIRGHLAEGEALFEVGFFRIIRLPPNTGAAFGLFPGQSFALAIAAGVTIVLLLICALFLYRRFPRLSNAPNRLALGLLLGGTAGNLIDRLNPDLGGVTDFISVGIWPAFNIADSAVVVGVILLAYSLRSIAGAVRGKG